PSGLRRRGAARLTRFGERRRPCAVGAAVYPAPFCAASAITFVTASGREIMERCPALTSVMWAWARFAMNSWIDDGIALSIVPTRSQLGIVFHAGGPEGAVKALNTAGPCVASRTAPSFGGRSLAN